MHRHHLSALIIGLFAFPAWVSTPATAAVAVHTYQITAGTSSGTFSIGNVTGGMFTVQFANTPCSGGAATCPATILSQYVIGTTGSRTLTYFEINAFNAGQLQGKHVDPYRSAKWSIANPTTMGYARAGFHATYSNGIPSIYGYIKVETPYATVAVIAFQGLEVGHTSLPEPETPALLLTGAIMLCAYAFHRRRRRSLA